MRHHFLGKCVPYSSQASKDAGKKLGLTPGGLLGHPPKVWKMIGDYTVKGCYGYKKNHEYYGEPWNYGTAVWFGTDPSLPDTNYKTPLGESCKDDEDNCPTNIRPKGFDCTKGLISSLKTTHIHIFLALTIEINL